MGDIVRLENGLACTVKRYRRARRIRIIIHPDGSVVLTLPFFVSRKRGLAFVAEKFEWIMTRVKRMAEKPQSLLFHGSAADFKRLAPQALRIVNERLADINRFYGAQWNRVTIRNQKTRWGSCSRRGDLSFNYRIVFLSEPLRDYLIVHELCHRLSFDHSPRFWKFVERTVPDYQERRKQLRVL